MHWASISEHMLRAPFRDIQSPRRTRLSPGNGTGVFLPHLLRGGAVTEDTADSNRDNKTLGSRDADALR